MPNVRLHQSGKHEARATLRKKSYSAYGNSPNEALANLEEKLNQLSEKPQDSRTFASFTQTVYQTTLEGKSKGYIRQVQWTTTHCESFANLPLQEVTRDILQRQINRLRTQGLGPTSLRHWRRIVWSIFNLAEADAHITQNPMRFVKAPAVKSAQAQPKHLQPHELTQLIQAAIERQAAALPTILLGGLLGLGFEEMRTLTPESIKPGEIHVHGTKNRYRTRVLPLPKKIAELLQHRKFPLLPKEDGATHSAISRVSNSIGLGNVGRHILRHTCATGLQELGCPLEDRELILGHANKSMSAHYSHSQIMARKTQWLNAWTDKVLPDNLGKDLGTAIQKPKKVSSSK